MELAELLAREQRARHMGLSQVRPSVRFPSDVGHGVYFIGAEFFLAKVSRRCIAWYFSVRCLGGGSWSRPAAADLAHESPLGRYLAVQSLCCRSVVLS